MLNAVRAMALPIALFASGIVLVASCGGDDSPPAPPDAGGPKDWPLMTVPTSAVTEPGIRRELFRVAGAVPPPNPMTGGQTPAELNFTQVVRYRQDVDPPAPAKAILVAMPGFLGAAGNWDALARNLVRQSVAAGAPVEVWAIDRRSNLLEDLRGMDTAEAAQNAEIASGYYFGDDTIGGQKFTGFLLQADLDFMSEWGLTTHIEDLHRVIAVVPQAQRKARVFLLGHSLGASMAEFYGGWRFGDGSRGSDEIAGFVLIDGNGGETPISEKEYQEGIPNGLQSIAGLDEIIASTRSFELPVLGFDVMPQSEILSMRYLYDPSGIIAGDKERDKNLDKTLMILLMVTPVPKITNAAVLGFGFDRASLPLTFAAVNCGKSKGGAIGTYDNAFGDGQLEHPTDPSATYDWVDAAEAGEFTPLANLAHAFVDGRVNLAEWYFPTRLQLDVRACSGGAVPASGYQATAGLRCFDAAQNDAPILAISTARAPPAARELEKGRVAAKIGPGRPKADAPRTDPAAFRAFHVDGMSHVDPLLGAAGPKNPVPGAILDFVGQNTQAGDVTVAVQPAP